jgi:hypothetical protein
MAVGASILKALPRAGFAVATLVLGLQLGGCAEMSDGMTQAFADPAKYELYNCKQLQDERATLKSRMADLQGLMAKAETGTGGMVVSELAYRNDYISIRGQMRFADEAWRRNKCQETGPGAPKPGAPAPSVAAAPVSPVAPAMPGPLSRSGSAVY